MEPRRYILNIASKEVHDATSLTEECNTDDIAFEHREAASQDRFDQLLSAGGWRLCGHCMPPTPVEAAPE